MSKLDEIIKACQETPLEKTASETKTEQNLSDGIVSLLSKQANTNTLNRDDLDQMRKEAQDAGVALAHEILKQANLVNPTMESLAAEQDAADLDNAQGTVNQIKEELIRRSLRDNAMYPNAEVEDMLEGKTEADAEAASQVKAAAISELVAQGFDFDTAAELVKQAADAPKAKAKSLNIGQRVDKAIEGANRAVEYVSNTAPVQYLARHGRGAVAHAKMLALGNPYGDNSHWKMRGAGLKGLAKNPLVQGTAALGALGAAKVGYDKYKEKTAFVNDLVSQGYDFDTAVDMVKEASPASTPKAKVSPATKAPVKFGDKVNSAIEYVSNTAPAQYLARHGKGAVAHAKMVAMGNPYGDNDHWKMRGAGLKGLAKNPLVQGTAALGALGAAKVGYDKYKEKTAFVNELVSQGYDFDTAVDMVKQASYEADLELQAMSSGFDKVAAVSELIDEGYSFEDASDLVKLASGQHEAELYKAAAIEEFVNQGLDYDLSVALVKEAAEGRDDLYQELLASMSE